MVVSQNLSGFSVQNDFEMNAFSDDGCCGWRERPLLGKFSMSVFYFMMGSWHTGCYWLESMSTGPWVLCSRHACPRFSSPSLCSTISE